MLAGRSEPASLLSRVPRLQVSSYVEDTTALSLTNMEIPVFCYHNAFADGLEKDLAFLADNDYETLLASEVVDVLTGARPAPDKAVALTFDEGVVVAKYRNFHGRQRDCCGVLDIA